MSYNNLVVLVNAAKVSDICAAFPDHSVYTDADFYEIFSGAKPFLGKEYGQDDISELCKAFDEAAKDKKILIHTFNPLLINFLEVHTSDKNDYSVFSLELSQERFFIFNNEKKFVPLLKIPEFARKLDVLSVGEAICDAHISDYM
jgi:hypothetical protein